MSVNRVRTHGLAAVTRRTRLTAPSPSALCTTLGQNPNVLTNHPWLARTSPSLYHPPELPRKGALEHAGARASVAPHLVSLPRRLSLLITNVMPNNNPEDNPPKSSKSQADSDALRRSLRGGGSSSSEVPKKPPSRAPSRSRGGSKRGASPRVDPDEVPKAEDARSG